jgi:hypothetical protein
MIQYFSFVGNYEIHRCIFLLMWISHYNSTIPLCLLPACLLPLVASQLHINALAHYPVHIF